MSRTNQRDCSGCRYWSEMLARAGAGTDNPRGDLEAMCFAAAGPFAGRYTTGTETCGYFKANVDGAVDDPRGTPR